MNNYSPYSTLAELLAYNAFSKKKLHSCQIILFTKQISLIELVYNIPLPFSTTPHLHFTRAPLKKAGLTNSETNNNP